MYSAKEEEEKSQDPSARRTKQSSVPSVGYDNNMADDDDPSTADALTSPQRLLWQSRSAGLSLHSLKSVLAHHQLQNAQAHVPQHPAPVAAQDVPHPVDQLQKVIISGAQQMVMDILLEASLKLTGMDKSTASVFVPVITLIREARRALASDTGGFSERLLALVIVLNKARNSLRLSSPDSVVFRGVDVLCDMANILHRGLLSEDLSALKAVSKKLASFPGLTTLAGSATSLAELALLLRRWHKAEITGVELVRRLADEVAPEMVRLPLNVAEKIGRGVREGKLSIDGVPPWPETADSVARLTWLKDALLNSTLRDALAGADKEWLMQTLGMDSEEADFMQAHLLQYARSLASFPLHGSPTEQLAALKTMPGLSELIDEVDISLNDNLGLPGSLLKDDTRLSSLGGIVTASGGVEMARQGLRLIDPAKVMRRGGQFGFELLKNTVGVSLDAARAVRLLGKKSYEFWQSAYSPGQSVADPVRFYRDFTAFIRQDMIGNPEDYSNATFETMLAAMAIFLRSLGGYHVPYGGNTAQWLEAYAKADPANLTAVDYVIMHAVLEPRVMLEIRHAMQQSDTLQSRKLLEPLSRALQSYVGDSPLLRRMAVTLPYVPALCEAWGELRETQHEGRQTPAAQLSQQVSLHDTILRNSRARVSPETQGSRQHALLQLQQKLKGLRGQGEAPEDRVEELQRDLNAMKSAVNAALRPGDGQERLADELETAQENLNQLKMPERLQGLSVEDVLHLTVIQQKLQQEVRAQLLANGVSATHLGQAQLQEINGLLESLEDTGALKYLAVDALARLATSTRPNLISLRGELSTLFRNAVSDTLADTVRWSAQQVKKLFIREVELTPEEEEEGWFVIERDISVGQVATGAAAGALLPALFLLLATGSSDSPAKMAGALTLQRMATDDNGASDLQQVRTGPSYAGVYGQTTEPVKQESREWQKWLLMALPVLAGGAAGAAVAASINPGIRAKPKEGGSTGEGGSAASMPGRLYTVTGENGVTKGIILTAADEEALQNQSIGEVVANRRPDGDRPRVKRSIDDPGTSDTDRENAASGIRQKRSPDVITEKPGTDILVSRINQKLQDIYEGGILRVGSALDPAYFIRQHIQNIIDANPEGHGTLTSPDSKLDFRPSVGGHATQSVTLMDLATGKFNYLKFNPVWDYQGEDWTESNPKVRFRNALLPGASNIITKGGLNLNSKKPGKGLPDIIGDKGLSEIELIKTQPNRLAKLSSFYELAFRLTAGELLKERSLSEFHPALNGYIAGSVKPLRISLFSKRVTEVISLRRNDKILAWDVAGTWQLITDTAAGRSNIKMQNWLLRHMDANDQHKYRNSRSDLFGTEDQIRIHIHGASTRTARSNFNLQRMKDIGSETAALTLARAEADMKSTISTRKEYLLNGVIDALYIAAGIALSPLLPGTGMILILNNIMLSAGLTLTKDMSKLIMSDSAAERESIIDSIIPNLIASLVVDGAFILGLPTAKQLLARGHIKIPWAKEANALKDIPLGLSGYHAANNVSEAVTDYTADSGPVFTFKGMEIHIHKPVSVNDIITHIMDYYMVDSSFSQYIEHLNKDKLTPGSSGKEMLPSKTVLKLPGLKLPREGAYYTIGYETLNDIVKEYKRLYRDDINTKIIKENLGLFESDSFHFDTILDPNTTIHL